MTRSTDRSLSHPMRSIKSFTILCWWVLTVAAFDLVEAKAGRSDCVPFSCGHIHDISYPFRRKHDPEHCGLSVYELSCENNLTILHNLRSCGEFHVQAINTNNLTFRAVDASILKNNGSSIPNSSLTDYMLGSYVRGVISNFPYSSLDCNQWADTPGNNICRGTYPIYFLKCTNPVNYSGYVDTSPCFNSQPNSHGYVKVNQMTVGDWKDDCSVERMSFVDLADEWDGSCKYIQNSLLNGFELKYNLQLGYVCGSQSSWTTNHKCFPKSFTGFFQSLWELFYDFCASGSRVNTETMDNFYIRSYHIDLRIALVMGIGLIVSARFILGAPLVIRFLLDKWRRRHLSIYNTIEEFLHGKNNFVPVRYSYSDIKKMSNKFKDKLGEGGYGCVFKAKLRSGRYGAIKMLNKPKANGEEFISEVATIGRIHHVNVVQLIGYCVEGSKCALVYDFMPNGSLDKYIYSKEFPLSYKHIYEISLGVAQGIEYLHQGCDMQILHFDIKPHNILLDQNFIPKISDFGLAKLYPTNNSIVSLTLARGTMGYIAPELFYKNIGGVSNKADVYSFGMLLMEMASKRKNLNAMVENSSQIYFPSWVYDQYNQGKEHLGMVDVTEEERAIIKKMIITALWCIQLKPSDRPSMNQVLEMLGGDVEHLQMPNKPFLHPQEMPLGDLQDTNLNPTGSRAEVTCTLSGR